eukprot:13973-Heterococcus_DN1.PRE.3
MTQQAHYCPAQITLLSECIELLCKQQTLGCMSVLCVLPFGSLSNLPLRSFLLYMSMRLVLVVKMMPRTITTPAAARPVAGSKLEGSSRKKEAFQVSFLQAVAHGPNTRAPPVIAHCSTVLCTGDQFRPRMDISTQQQRELCAALCYMRLQATACLLTQVPPLASKCALFVSIVVTLMPQQSMIDDGFPLRINRGVNGRALRNGFL